MQQKLIQIHNEIMELAQDQESCNSVLGMMLSSAECLSSRFGKTKFERLFNGYNAFQSGDTKTEDSLKIQLRIQTKLFRNNYCYMIEKKGKYIFPENFDIDKIIEIVNIWKSNVQDDKKIFYNNIIDIITNNKIEIKYPRQKIDKVQTDGVSQNLILNVMGPIMSHVDQGLEQVGKEAELKGKINNALKIGHEHCDDKNLENHIKKRNNENETKRNNLKEQIIKDLENCFCMGECYFFLHLDSNSKVKFNPKFKTKESYQTQNFFDIQTLFKNHLSSLEKSFAQFKKNYGESKTIASFIDANYSNANNWKFNCNDQLFTKFINILNIEYH